MSQTNNKYKDSLKSWIKTAEHGIKHDEFVLKSLKAEVKMKLKLIELETLELKLKREVLKNEKQNLRKLK